MPVVERQCGGEKNNMVSLNKTHDPDRKSWVEAANAVDAEFPIQNLPWGVFSIAGGEHRIGVAIGDRILNVTRAEAVGLVRPGGSKPVFDQGVLNPYMALQQSAWSETRAPIADLLDAKCGPRNDLTLVAMRDTQ